MAERFQCSMLEYPFGPDARAYEVGGKMFCTLSEDPPHTAHIKAESEMIDEQRTIFPDAIDRAPYMHERRWNRVRITDVPDFELEDWLESPSGSSSPA